jgi:hypothetical protein
VGLSESQQRGKLLDDRDYVVSSCNGDCSKGKQRSATISMPSRFGFAIMGNVTYDFCGGEACIDGGFGDYEWRPTTALGPSQQLYQLDHTRDGLSDVSAGLAAALLFPEMGSGGRFGIGLGTTLLSASTLPAKQWNLNFYWSPRVMERNYFYFVAGPGFRVDSVPLVDKVGDRIVVSTTNGASSAPPSPATRTVCDFVGSVGIAINLSSPIADYAPKIFSGGGGSK